MKTPDVIVVGCGLTGASAARVLAENGLSVRIVEKRDHIGGNMFDFVDSHGILVHKYGPHTFHTNEKYLYDFMARFCDWDEYRLTCGAQINGICTPTPFNFSTVDSFFDKEKADAIKRSLLAAFPERKTVTVVEALECEDDLVREYAQFLFDNDYSLYTAKQWGVSPKEIDKSVLKRVPLRLDYGVGYFDDSYQVMPQKSYKAFFDSLLDHENIKIELNVDALDFIKADQTNGRLTVDGEIFEGAVLYTGPLDELFGLGFGPLPYRSLRFEPRYENVESKQDMPVVAYPQADAYTRMVEYKKLPVQNVKGTTYVVEYPLQYEPNTKQEPYYPVLTENSKKQYGEYKRLADGINNLFLCGRLADFQYYNMDQALKKALQTAENILSQYKRG